MIRNETVIKWIFYLPTSKTTVWAQSVDAPFYGQEGFFIDWIFKVIRFVQKPASLHVV